MNLYRYVHNNPLSLVDPFGLNEYWCLTVGGTAAVKIIGLEGGVFFLYDESNGDIYTFWYGSFGLGPGLGAAVTIEGGMVGGTDDPAKDLTGLSGTVSGFAAAPLGFSGQTFGDWFWGGDIWGATGGISAGAGAGISGMVTSSGFVDKQNIRDYLKYIPEWLLEYLPDGLQRTTDERCNGGQ